MIRLFCAIEVPPATGQALQRLQVGIKGARWRPLDTLHVTLCFFGEITEPVADDLAAELTRAWVAPFELTLTGAGAFDQQGDRGAVWVGVKDSEALHVLAGRTRAAARRAGVRLERRSYLPHVTLAYLRRSPSERVGAWVRNRNLTRLEPFTVERFALLSSHQGRSGSSYRLERTYPLQ